MSNITINCSCCQQGFEKSFSVYNYAIKNRNQKYFYCSTKCEQLFKEQKAAQRKTVQCGFCQKIFLSKYEIKKSKNKTNYCSHQCANKDIAVKYKKGKPNNIKKSKAFTKVQAVCSICTTPTKSKLGFCRPCKKLQIKPIPEARLNRTKGELFKLRTSWQSARSEIRKLAEKLYKESGLPIKCLICNYCQHVEICHLKAVSDFDDDATVREINNISNLVALCRNHHWEQENNLIPNLSKLIAERGYAPTQVKAYET